MAWTERYVDVNADGSGDGTTTATSGSTGAWTLAQAVSNEAAGMRINIKAGTYSNGSTSRTFSAAAASASPICLRGYKTTPGDMDENYAAVPGTDIPLFTFSGTANFAVTGGAHILMNLSISGSSTNTNGIFQFSGSSGQAYNCSATNTGSGATSYALQAGAGGNTHVGCVYSKTTGSSQVVNHSSSTKFIGCVFSGGSNSISGTTQGPTCIACYFLDSSGSGIVTTSGGIVVINCAFRNHTSNGITFSSSSNHLIVANYFESCATAAVNNTSGGNVLVHAVANVINDCGDRFLGITESFEMFAGPDLGGSSGFTDAANGNYLPNDLLQDEGFPKLWPGLTGTATPSAGPAQLYNLGGGGAALARVFSGF